MKSTATSLLIAGSLFCAATAHAESPLIWQDNSLTYLYGKDFKVNPAIQQTLTFEHASAWNWGDLFIFVDWINYNGESDSNLGKETYYGEFTPRLSFGKLSGKDLSFGPIKDVLLAGTYERGENRNRNYLLGPGLDIDVPGFDYFQINLYYRKPDGITQQPSGQWQVTPVWGITLPVGNSDLLIDGYMDWVVNSKGSEARGDRLERNLHFNPQIKYDLGKSLGYEAKHLYVGAEYDYWSNKYGIKDGGFVSENFVGKTDQNTASLLVKYHF
ncbi:outer membrane protein OmpK [Pseudomonas matsuisoli]|uniref:Nucleoside-specific outer membrane channel protein Tsx n=1 Tax=Pseudomonas matsuisoli TaxID=1515666 RepID=A0A917UZC9_9PSED|nr:outer membrane protein OmpK [Pseudomonas matsuisoli]GGK00094.1 hypothetical protein GCM10009304_27380 [Pseudomonas matsuisoli]